MHMRENRALSASRLGLVEGSEPELEGGANAHLSKVVEQCKIMCLGTALEGAYASGGARQVHRGARHRSRRGRRQGSMVLRMHMLPGEQQYQVLPPLQCLHYPL